MRHYPTYGRWLAVLRFEAGLTQEELATKAGVGRSYLSKIERGEVELPGRDIRERIGHALGFVDEGPWRGEQAEVGDEDVAMVAMRVAARIAKWSPDQRRALWRLIENAAALIEASSGEED